MPRAAVRCALFLLFSEAIPLVAASAAIAPAPFNMSLRFGLITLLMLSLTGKAV